MSGLRFDHVWKMYSHQSPAVADLDLEITEGEFLVLVGPSGCGKTTSLRMLAGLERPSYGRIWLGDRDVTDVPPVMLARIGWPSLRPGPVLTS
jgi:multiple sugar transport system ATP-binding protein